MSAFDIKVENTWKTASEAYVKVDGVWKTATGYYVKAAGQWKGIFNFFPSEYVIFDNGVFADGCNSIKNEYGLYRYTTYDNGYLEAYGGVDSAYNCYTTAIALCAGYDTPDLMGATPNLDCYSMRGFDLSKYKYLHVTLKAASSANDLDKMKIGLLKKEDGYNTTATWPNGPTCTEFAIYPQQDIMETFTIDIQNINDKAAIYVWGVEGNHSNKYPAYLYIYKVWLDNGEEDTGASDTPSSPKTYTITHNYTNVSSNNIVETIEQGSTYTATLTASDGYKLDNIVITDTDTGNDITLSGGCSVSLETGTVEIVVNTNITITATAVENESPSNGKIYIFDSSRSDNFLFGKYEYEMSSGNMLASALTSWPYQYDESNTSSSRIVLVGQSSGMLKPTAGNEGYCNAVLKIKANTSDGTQFMNNVTYEGYAANEVGIPNDQALTIYINAYVEKNAGSPTFAYCSSSGAVEASTTITSTSLTKYSINISALSTGYIQLSAGTGCGSLIVTDIWAE